MSRRFPFKESRYGHLVAGLVTFTVMTLIVGELSDDIRNGEPITLVDVRFSAWLSANRPEPLTTALWLITSLHSTWPVAIATFAVGVGLWLRRQKYWLAAVWLTVYGGMLLNWMLKLVFQRARPSFAEPILTLTGYSFPSGHTMMATTLYGILGLYALSKTGSNRGRIVVMLVPSAMIALVGFSRIYLGAHYLSDVLGAMAEGLAWMSLCLTVVYSVRRHRAEKSAG